MAQTQLFGFGYLIALVLLAAGRGLTADMIFPAKDWSEATPESQNVVTVRLIAAIDYLKANSGSDGVRKLVIIRNGRLIWKGDEIDNVHGVWSCTKSFTSTVLGLLVDDGKCTLASRAAEFVPEMATNYSTVTLRHFTTMISGYRAIGDQPSGSYKHGPSSTPFEPNPQSLFTPPGSQYAYWDSAMNMFGLVLTRIAGEPMEALFKRRIADPIGMNRERWRWGIYATNNGVAVNGGSGNGNKHVFVSARELARLGHLFLNHGNWNGRQLISSNWVGQATAVQVSASLPWAQPESEIDGRGCYGFNWWANGLNADGKRLWRGAPTGTFAAMGHNNNKLLVIPEWRMVIVRLGLDQQDKKITDDALGQFLRLVGEALMDDVTREEHRKQ
jgi:CubicO group peptidase (beta-lactamase class C family)